MEKAFCLTCDNRQQCKKPCKPVSAYLWQDNHVYERHYEDTIVVFPPKHEVHFNQLPEDEIDNFSDADSIPWSSGDYQLSQTRVFIEKFFNKVSTSELATRFGVRDSVISTMYRNCLYRVEQMLALLDLRASGIKNLKPDRFTEDQKMFLLVHVFRFNAAEVAEMFHHSANYTSAKLNRMADKYKEAFMGIEKPVESRCRKATA